jgi:hypothetical protein
MKKIVFILLAMVSFMGCKDNTKTEPTLEENRAKSYDQNDGYITIKGEFVFDADQNAAVFESPNGTIYSVVVDDNMHQLNKEVQPFKEHKYSSVPVTVRVKKIKNTNPNIKWEQALEIKEVLKVEKPNPNKEDVIKLSN